LPDPQTAEYKEQLQETKENCFKILESMHFVNTRLILETLLDNEDINSDYKKAEINSANRFINRHDKLHALKTTLYSLKIFSALRDDVAIWDCSASLPALKFETPKYFYESEVFDLQFIKECACAVVMVASYLHDLCKYMKKHSEAAGIYTRIKLPQWLQPLTNPKMLTTADYIRAELCPLVSNCITKHEAKDPAENAEEGIVMLSDKLDNDMHRIRGEFPPEVVLRKDKNPIEYYSCRAVQVRVDTSTDNRDRPIFVEFQLADNSGWHQAHRFLKAMRRSGLKKFIRFSIAFNDRTIDLSEVSR
jgi:metal-dependent HD superfamily phosphatase/phosphodiesterase